VQGAGLAAVQKARWPVFTALYFLKKVFRCFELLGAGSMRLHPLEQREFLHENSSIE